jgi:HSP20 family protein
MALIKRDPFVRSLSRWPSLWDEDFFDFPATTNSGLDVYETEDEVVVKANVAGVPAEEVDLTFDKGVLWVRAEAEEKEKDKKKKHYSRSSWSYSYKVSVPGEVDYQTDPEAAVAGGVLTVTFKKSEQAKPKKLAVKAK